MDTRTKILPADDAVARMPHMAFLVSGWFDPLLAAHAAWLDEIPEQFSVVVLVTDPPDPLLPTQARAELVAALRRVEMVILADDELHVEPALRLEPQESALRDAFLQHVRDRQS